MVVQVSFLSEDSLVILAQNSNPSIMEIDKVISLKLNSTTFEIELEKRNEGKEYDFYSLSIPIISLDRHRAYVELKHRCGHLCGNGKGFYLSKVDGKWMIVKQWRTWTSSLFEELIISKLTSAKFLNYYPKLTTLNDKQTTVCYFRRRQPKTS